MNTYNLNGTLVLDDGTEITDGHIEVSWVTEFSDGRKVMELVFYNDANEYRIAREFEFQVQGNAPIISAGTLRNYVTSVDAKFSINTNGQGNGGSQNGGGQGGK